MHKLNEIQIKETLDIIFKLKDGFSMNQIQTALDGMNKREALKEKEENKEENK